MVPGQKPRGLLLLVFIKFLEFLPAPLQLELAQTHVFGWLFLDSASLYPRAGESWRGTWVRAFWVVGGGVGMEGSQQPCHMRSSLPCRLHFCTGVRSGVVFAVKWDFWNFMKTQAHLRPDASSDLCLHVHSILGEAHNTLFCPSPLYVTFLRNFSTS